MSGQKQTPIETTVAQLIETALKQRAEAVHIEPRQNVTVIRVRTDGRLHDIAKLPKEHHQAIVEHLSALNNQEKLHRPGTQIHFNIAPVMHGHKVVLHIKQQTSQPQSLSALGYWGPHLGFIEHALSEPHGVIQAASLDHHVANRTLQTMAHGLLSSHRNIVTIESDASQSIDGILELQTPQHEQAERLRHALQQDSDVIITGTVIDRTTAELGYEVGLSHHLILGSMYADSAAQLVKRTLDMGIAPHLVAAGLHLATAQRLVPLLCEHCRQAYAPSKSQLKRLAKRVGCTLDDFFVKAHALEETARASQLATNQTPPSTTPTTIKHFWKASEVGCDRCNYRGYNGRIAICEVMPITAKIQSQIAANLPTSEIVAEAQAVGMVTLDWDGLVKALCGLVGLEETFGKQYR